MIKYLLIILNSFAIFIFNFLSGESVSLSTTFADNITVGKEFTVNLKVKKGNITGFANLQLVLPAGVEVKGFDDQGAAFSSKNGVACWEWNNVPEGEEINVKVVMLANKSAAGEKKFTLKYSYVENNTRQIIEMEPEGLNTAMAAISDAAGTSAGIATTPQVGNEPAANIVVVRTINRGASDNEFIVTLKIVKGLTKGFARYSDDIIDGITAKAIKTDGSSFSVADGKIKFVWVNVPENEELEISYTLNGSSQFPVVLNGEYAYLEDNQSKKYLLIPETILMPPPAGQQPDVAVQETQPTNTVEPEKTTENEKQGTENEQTIVAQEAGAAENNTTVQTKEREPENAAEKKEVNSTEPIAGKKPKGSKKDGKKNGKVVPSGTSSHTEAETHFVVQVGAFKKATVTVSTLKQKFSINEDIRSEMQDGFSKFMVGSHAEYKSAHDHREEMIGGKGVKSAFVAAYNQGKRITVQEALMTLNQKWLK